ncbi:MAG TPA: glycosyltransferase, partial [Phaeodactylibacter sp.]|nr:glycosyltransferase [Phaeodactylibacter sp.]
MLFYFSISIFLSVLYGWLMLRYYFDWQSIPVYQPPEHIAPHTKVSILVPARNEAANIRRCIQSLLQQQYPPELYEIIVIDDHSEDHTAAIVESIGDSRLHLLRLSDFSESETIAYKKQALTVGIGAARGKVILTTDADCVMSPESLGILMAYYEAQHPKMIAAPVVMTGEKSLLERFQALDFCGMMGVTGAGILKGYMLMGNGAHIAYEKKAFKAVNGFEGIDHLASGDDMLLMQKIAAAYPGGVHFLKNSEAIVHTKAQSTWKAFISQRIRWASKSAAYPQKGVSLQLAIVFFFCCTLFLNILLMPFFPMLLGVVLFQWIIKAFVDFILLNALCRFFDKRKLVWSFIPA